MSDGEGAAVHGRERGRDHGFAVEPVTSLRQLVQLLERYPDLYVRYSRGPAADASKSSIDTESGLELPGLSVNPLSAEPWWCRPVEDWLARQLCQYKHLAERNPARFAWTLTGRTVARGPDCEPLLAETIPIALLSRELLAEAEARYERNFRAGHGPED